jgi:hypothetical protein
MVIAAIVGTLVVRRVCRHRLDRSGHVGHGQQWGNDSHSVYLCCGSFAPDHVIELRSR